MRRRKFIAVLGGAAAVAGDVPVVVWAQRVLARAPDELPRVILLSAGDGADSVIRTSVVAFEQGMRALRTWLDLRWLDPVANDPLCGKPAFGSVAHRT
jgi:hypothetical protein